MPAHVTFRRILVPLDGSRLAEAILPAAQSLAQRLGASVLLLHVLERDAPRSVHGEPHLGRAAEARSYLDAHAARLRDAGVDTEIHVTEQPADDVAAEIERQSRALDADLVAMCAHGRGGLRDRLLGTIAERVLRVGHTPILLRTVRRAEAVPFQPRRLLVPIDFAHDVDLAVSAARGLADAYGAGVALLSAPEPASPETTRRLPGTSALLREIGLEDLRRRLDEVAERLRASVADVQTIVDERRPTEAIVAARDALPADLIILITDAHGRLSRWYDRSTAQRLLARPELTVLLIKEER